MLWDTEAFKNEAQINQGKMSVFLLKFDEEWTAAQRCNQTKVID